MLCSSKINTLIAIENIARYKEFQQELFLIAKKLHVLLLKQDLVFITFFGIYDSFCLLRKWYVN